MTHRNFAHLAVLVILSGLAGTECKLLKVLSCLWLAPMTLLVLRLVLCATLCSATAASLTGTEVGALRLSALACDEETTWVLSC